MYGHTGTFGGVPLAPLRVVKRGTTRHIDHGLNGQVVFESKSKVTLVVCGHTHYSTIAVTHEHIVAHPQRHGFACDGVCHSQTSVHAHFVFDGHLGFGGATLLARRNKGRQGRLACRCVRGQCMLWCDCAEGHAHDGVCTGGKHVHAPVTDQLTGAGAYAVFKREAHTFALAYPVFLHGAYTLRPPAERGIGVAILNMRQQLWRVIGDLEVVAGDLAFLNHRACAPAFAINNLLVGQHRFVDWIPVHNLGLAVGNTLAQHLQK